jgi:hypothetical protein
LLGLDVVVVRAFVGDVFVEEEAFVPLEKMMVAKGLRSPEIVKTPSPVWRLQLVGGSLSQQKPSFPQLMTPASEREL